MRLLKFFAKSTKEKAGGVQKMARKICYLRRDANVGDPKDTLVL